MHLTRLCQLVYLVNLDFVDVLAAMNQSEQSRDGLAEADRRKAVEESRTVSKVLESRLDNQFIMMLCNLYLSMNL